MINILWKENFGQLPEGSLSLWLDFVFGHHHDFLIILFSFTYLVIILSFYIVMNW